MDESLSIFLPILFLIGVASNPSDAQKLGPQGVSVASCVTVGPSYGSYHFTNGCKKMVIEVAAAQAHNGQPKGSGTFQLLPKDSYYSGSTTQGGTFYWACSAPLKPTRASTHASPMSNATDVVCTGGSASGAVVKSGGEAATLSARSIAVVLRGGGF